MNERLLDAVDLIEKELQIIRNKDDRIEDILIQLENLREIITNIRVKNPIEKAERITLDINDIVYGNVPKKNLSKVVEINLSQNEVSPISEEDVETISKFFQDNELPNLVTLRIDGRPNAKDIIKRIFGSTETKKTLYSLSEISVINSKLKEEEELSRDTIECILNHFKDYSYLIRPEQQYGAYRTKQGIIEELVAPLMIYMNTVGMGTYLPWFMGDYRDGKRVLVDKKIKCHYLEWDTSADVSLYINIKVSN